MKLWLLLILLLGSFTGYGQNELSFFVKKLNGHDFYKWDSIDYYCLKILELSDKSQHSEQGLAYKFLGNVQWTKSNYDSAISLYNKALFHYNLLGDSTQLSKLFNNYGVAYRAKANYAKSLEYFSKAYRFYPSDSISEFATVLLYNIGRSNFNLKNLIDAEKFHLKAYELSVKRNDSARMSVISYNLGLVASAKNKSKIAMDFYSKSLKINSNLNLNSSETIAAIGREYHLKGEIKKAIPYYKDALQEAKRFNSRGELPHLHLILGQAILTIDEPDPDNNMDKAIKIATELGQRIMLLHAHEFLAWYYEEHGQFESALEHHRKFKVLGDSILNENSYSKLNTLNVKYKTAQNEKQIVNQKLLLNEKNAAILEQKNQTLQIASALISIIFVIILFYIRTRMQQKNKLQQVLIQEKEKGLKAVFSATETERQRISKDLHDGIGQQLSGIKMQLESLAVSSDELKEQKKHITNNLANATQEIRQISHQMMPRSLEENGLIITLEDLFEKTFGGTDINCSFEHHNVNQRFPEDIELSIYRITQELINNIIKHANAKSVEVQLYKIKNSLVMTVVDDGIGFNTESKSDGHGLLNIKSRIETVNGKVKYESSQKSETVITLSIPIT